MKQRLNEPVNPTPMIDVVFQLLVYFVLTFEIPDRVSRMQVWSPRGDGGPGPPPPSVTVSLKGVAFHDRFMTPVALERTFNRLADLNPDQAMIVVATADSRHHQLVEVLNLARKAGLENVSLLSAK